MSTVTLLTSYRDAGVAAIASHDFPTTLHENPVHVTAFVFVGVDADFAFLQILHAVAAVIDQHDRMLTHAADRQHQHVGAPQRMRRDPVELHPLGAVDHLAAQGFNLDGLKAGRIVDRSQNGAAHHEIDPSAELAGQALGMWRSPTCQLHQFAPIAPTPWLGCGSARCTNASCGTRSSVVSVPPELSDCDVDDTSSSCAMPNHSSAR